MALAGISFNVSRTSVPISRITLPHCGHTCSSSFRRCSTTSTGIIVRHYVLYAAGLLPGVGRHLGGLGLLRPRRGSISLRLIEQQTQLPVQLLLSLLAGCAKLFLPQQAQLLHQPPVLLRRELPRLLTVPRPLEAAAFQPLIHQYKPVSLPVQSFDLILPPSTEQKQRVWGWLQLEPRLHRPSQAIDPTPQIRVPADKVCRTDAFEIVQHDFSAQMIARIDSGSAPVWMFTRSAPHSILATVSATAGLTETSTKRTSFSDTAAWNTFLCQL